MGISNVRAAPPPPPPPPKVEPKRAATPPPPPPLAPSGFSQANTFQSAPAPRPRVDLSGGMGMPTATATAPATTLRTERLGDGRANCLEQAHAAARPGDTVLLCNDTRDASGHAVVLHPDGTVTDPNPPSTTWPSQQAWQAANPHYQEAGRVGQEALDNVLSLPPGPERNAQLRLLGLDGVADVAVADAADTEQQLADAHAALESAIAEMNGEGFTAERWAAVQAAAGAYESAIEEAYGVTINQSESVPNPSTDYLMARLDPLGTQNAVAAAEMAELTMNLLSNFHDGLDATATYLAESTGNPDRFAAFQEVLGDLTFNLTDTPPKEANGARGYTAGQTVYFHMSDSARSPIASDLLIHELGHVLSYRAGNGNGENAPLQSSLGSNSTRLTQAETLMEKAGDHRQHDDPQPREVSADLFLYAVRGYASPGRTLDSLLDDNIEAASAYTGR